MKNTPSTQADRYFNIYLFTYFYLLRFTTHLVAVVVMVV